MEQGLSDAKRYFPFSNYPLPDLRPKCQNVLDLPKLGAIMVFLTAPSLWLVPILLCTPISNLARISKDEQHWVNTRKSVGGQLHSMRKRGKQANLGVRKQEKSLWL